MLLGLSLALASCAAAESAPDVSLPAAEMPTAGANPKPSATAAFSPTATQTPTPEPTQFSFQEQLTGHPSQLSLWIEELDPHSGKVVVNGADMNSPTAPFTVDWGDGETADAWFPCQHTYADTGKNYLVAVTAHYSQTDTGAAELLVRFAPPVIEPIPLPENLRVTIPVQKPKLTSRLYAVPGGLTTFTDEFFAGGLTPREAVEYVLSLAAYLQYDFANENVYTGEDGFPQVLLMDPSAQGMYSLWFTDPVSLASGEYGLSGTLQYSSFFHEMGHNFTLNSPAAYYTGGKIDGNANAIYSETLANIFAHATAYELLRKAGEFGLDDGLAAEIRQSALSSMAVTRSGYEDYLAAGKSFHSWNDPATADDETFGTFMTIAYKFCERAEADGSGYREPVKRMMVLLQKFNPDWHARYSAGANSPAAEAFRATWMVAALSYAFSADLRDEFRALQFPIDDAAFEELLNAASG
ncbi:MAG: hypothetical protein JW929_06550 [Anaerolineales bacterium]|nr:hypothetical protein [Anaerolineales bacterium]